MEIERRLGFEPTDRKLEKLGYDIESRIPGTGKLRFIEVKSRIAGAPIITVTRNEILYSLNKPDDFTELILRAEELFDRYKLPAGDQQLLPLSLFCKRLVSIGNALSMTIHRTCSRSDPC